MAERRPRVCVVVTTPLIVHFFIRPHLLALARHFDVSLVVNLASDAYAGMPDVPVEIVHLPIARKVSLLRDSAALLRLIAHFAFRRYDLVYSVTPKAGLLAMSAAALARIPLRVHTFQGEVWAQGRGFRRRLLKAMDTLTAKAATHTLAVSRSEQAFLEAERVVAPGSLRVLGAGSIGGVDLERFSADEAARATVRAALGVPENHVLCAYVGRLTADKGVLDLAQAYVRLYDRCPGLRLAFVGPDEEGMRERIESICADRRDRLAFAGYTDAPESYMAAADFLCLPSYREGFGMVVVEAAAVGIPAVGSRIYGVTDAIVDGETGLLFAPGDVGDLAAKLARLAADADLRRTLGLNARRRVRRDYAQTAVIAAFVGYLRELLAGSRR